MLTVEVMLYAEEAGGRKEPITDIGYGCACKAAPDDEAACECRINFYNKYPVRAGETRRADIFFLTGEDAETFFKAAGTFYLCEEGVIGEARAVQTRKTWPWAVRSDTPSARISSNNG
jgi:hypothetical protein